MYRIAFKRYKVSDNYVEGSYPDNLIVEFELFNNHIAPWEALLENDFSIEFAKNTLLIQDFINTQVALNMSKELTKLHVLKKQMADDKTEFQIYLQFLDWKDKMAKEQSELKAKEIKRLQDVQAGLKDTGEIKFNHPTMDRLNQFNNTRMRIR